jgi:hypothetical protein
MPIIKFRHGQEISSSKLNDMIEILNNLEKELVVSKGWNTNVASVVEDFKTDLVALNLRLDGVDQSLPSLEALIETFANLKDSLLSVIEWTDGSSVESTNSFPVLVELINQLTASAVNENQEGLIESLTDYLGNSSSKLLIFRGTTDEITLREKIDKQILFNTQTRTILVDGRYTNGELERKVFGIGDTLNSLITIGSNGNWYIEGTDTLKPSRGPTGFEGPSGTNGTNGLNGTKVESGAVLPTNNYENYNVGDLFFKTPGENGIELNLFELVLQNGDKVWQAQTTIQGPAGPQGTPGKQPIFEIFYSVEDPNINPLLIQQGGIPPSNTTYIGIIKYFSGENIPDVGWIKVRPDTFYPVITNDTLSWSTQPNPNILNQSFNVRGPKGIQATITETNITTTENSTQAQAAFEPINLNSNTWRFNVSIPRGLTGAQGATGATGPQGIQGQVGPQGSDGTSVQFKGSFATTASLPSTGQTLGDGYIIGGGNLWVYADSEDIGNVNGFINVGNIQGPIGPAGPIGPEGPTGPGGPQGIQGNPGIQGLTGSQGPTGLTGADGPAGPVGPAGPQGVSTYYVASDLDFPTNLDTYLVGDTFISRATGNSKYIIEAGGVKALLNGSTLIHADLTATSAVPNKLLYLNNESKLPADITGNAASASQAAKLTTARTISGVSFSGEANIILPHLFSKQETLLSGTWNSGTRQYTLNIPEITTVNAFVVVASSQVNDDLYNICNVRAVTQSSQQLIFQCDTLPTSNLIIEIMYRN